LLGLGLGIVLAVLMQGFFSWKGMDVVWISVGEIPDRRSCRQLYYCWVPLRAGTVPERLRDSSCLLAWWHLWVCGLMAEAAFLGRLIQSAGARLRDDHAESKPGFCFLFECQGRDLGLAFPAAREGVNRLHVCFISGL